jgi:hypothetical protein
MRDLASKRAALVRFNAVGLCTDSAELPKSGWDARASCERRASSDCPVNTFSASGANACQSCPGSSTSAAGQGTCSCNPGYISNGFTGASLRCTGMSAPVLVSVMRTDGEVILQHVGRVASVPVAARRLAFVRLYLTLPLVTLFAATDLSVVHGCALDSMQHRHLQPRYYGVLHWYVPYVQSKKTSES